MELTLTDDQGFFRDTTRRFLTTEAPLARTRRDMVRPGGYDRALWRKIAEELGWAAIAIPEVYGGFGLGAVEIAVLQEELGRSLACTPFFATVCMAANALRRAGTDEQQAAWLPGIASGEVTATLAWVGHPRRWDAQGVGATWALEADGYRLRGSLLAVVDGATADLLLVCARGPDDALALFVVPRTLPGVACTGAATMDQTRRSANVNLEDVLVPHDARMAGETDVLAVIFDEAATALAAEQLGVAERCLEMAVDYAKVRRQFGRPIGSFQSIKHKLADLLVAVESARSAAWYAAWAASAAPDELPVAASLAKAWCSDAVFKCAAENIQVHGGIGFTWEHDAHLYFKRARASESFLGDATWHREQLAVRLGW